jgi:hypothetical protein
MARPRYTDPHRLPREKAIAQLRTNVPQGRIDAILSLALYDPDWKLAQAACLDGLADDEDDVVATAILGLGHIARLHRHLSLDIVVPRLEALKGRSDLISGRLDDTLDDIAIYLRRNQPLD